MHNKNQNKKTVAFVNIEDLNRDPEGVMAAIEAYEQEHSVPEERDDRTLEEVEADLNESLIALDKHFQPMPRPTPEEIEAGDARRTPNKPAAAANAPQSDSDKLRQMQKMYERLKGKGN